MRKKIERIDEVYVNSLSKKEQVLFFDKKMFELVTNIYGINESQALSISYVMFLVFECEGFIARKIESIMKLSTRETNVEFITTVLDELTFTGKINIYENLLKENPLEKNLLQSISYFRQINDIRNKLFHCKISSILYKNKPITDIYTRIRILQDYQDIAKCHDCI